MPLTADPGVSSLNLSQATQTFDYEIISTGIPPLPPIEKGNDQLLAKVCAS